MSITYILFTAYCIITSYTDYRDYIRDSEISESESMSSYILGVGNTELGFSVIYPTFLLYLIWAISTISEIYSLTH